MRKRNCVKLFDNILWYTLYLLPVILLIGVYFSVYHDTGNMPNLFDAMGIIFGDHENVPVVNTINLVFLEILEYFYFDGTANAVTAFTMMCCANFVIVYLLHLFTDFLLFIPRLCHKWMNDFTQGD